MTDKQDDSNISSLEDARNKKKEKFQRLKEPATKEDLKIFFDKILNLEEELEFTKSILTKTLRLLKEVEKRLLKQS